jgi:hypothetical protein
MSCEAEIHLGDIGTIFRVTVQDTDCAGVTSVLDISGATTTEFIFKKPGGTTVTKAATFTTTGVDGQLDYTTILDDLDEVGEWRLQVYVVLPSGSWRSDIVSFQVYENL